MRCIATKGAGRSDANEDQSGVPRDEWPDPGKQAHATELRRLLESRIDRLPVPCRSVFVLRAAEGLATREVAEGLEISEDALRTRLFRARALLRRHIYESTHM